MCSSLVGSSRLDSCLVVLFVVFVMRFRACTHIIVVDAYQVSGVTIKSAWTVRSSGEMVSHGEVLDPGMPREPVRAKAGPSTNLPKSSLRYPCCGVQIGVLGSRVALRIP